MSAYGMFPTSSSLIQWKGIKSVCSMIQSLVCGNNQKISSKPHCHLNENAVVDATCVNVSV